MLNVTWDLVEKFTKNPRDVFIQEEQIEKEIDLIKNIEPVKEKYPNCVSNINSLVVFQLIENSVNYCFWYGTSTIRPNDADFNKMHSLLEESYNERNKIESTIERFIDKLIDNRFPLIKERIYHLKQIVKGVNNLTCEKRIIDICGILAKEIYGNNIEIGLKILLKYFPGYAEDLFLKRASLFFIQLNRVTGKFGNTVNCLPIPADYQVPRVLISRKLLKYSDKLSTMIDEDILIPKNSRIECEIRAATIKVIKILSDKSGKNIGDIDYYLWKNRNFCSNKFHLTLTTDY